MRGEDGGLRSARQHVAGERDLALAVDAVDEDGPVPGTHVGDFIEADGAHAWKKARSFWPSPSTLPRNCSWARTTHVVLIFAGVEGGRDLARDQRVQGRFDIHGRRRPDRPHWGDRSSRRTSGLPLRRVVSASVSPGMVFILASNCVGVVRQLVEVGALDEVLDVGVALIAADGATSSTPVWISGGYFFSEVAGALHELLLGDIALVDIGELDEDGWRC